MELTTATLLAAFLFLFLFLKSYIQLPFPIPRPHLTSNNQRVSWLHSIYSNYKVANREWRIPQLCQFISDKYGKVAELSLLGQRVIILTDHKMAGAVMSRFSKSLRQRFGNDEGLEKLNMLGKGLIWNNDTPSWKRNRLIFEATLANGMKVVEDLSRDYFKTKFASSLKLFQPNSLLTLLRHYTVTMTMEALFGLDCATLPEGWEERVIGIVGNYFKAWEFFLLTPETMRFPDQQKTHETHCQEIHQLAEDIYAMSGQIERARSKFIQDLEEVNKDKEQVLQCITEMLLAGTDTSSLTMYYTCLFLADYPGVADELAGLLQEGVVEGEAIDRQIARFYNESMRLISVGPVILRQAERDIHWQDSESGETLHLAKGDGIIFNVAGMHLKDSTFPRAEVFDPSRYWDQGQPFPLPFGLGNKSCVGKGFAEKEMKAFFSWFLQDHTLLGGESGAISHMLQTRWDIANAPLKDIQLYVFPRRPLYLLGGEGEVQRRVEEIQKLVPSKLKVREYHEVSSEEVETNQFEIIYNLPEDFESSFEKRGRVIMRKKALLVHFLGEKEQDGLHKGHYEFAVGVPNEATTEEALQVISHYCYCT